MGKHKGDELVEGDFVVANGVCGAHWEGRLMRIGDDGIDIEHDGKVDSISYFDLIGVEPDERMN